MNHLTVLAANQPNYWPSLSFWHKLSQSDIFVILDDAQFSTQDFHHRQRIRTNSALGFGWLTIPVYKDQISLKDIRIKHNAKIKGISWSEYHLHLIKTHYEKMSYFNELLPFLEKLYSSDVSHLVDFNLEIIWYLCKKFSISTEIVKASELKTSTALPGSLRLVQICKELGVSRYLSGMGAKTQMSFNAKHFSEANIDLKWLEFLHPLYQQAYEPFMPNMGCIDALCCAGDLFLVNQQIAL